MAFHGILETDKIGTVFVTLKLLTTWFQKFTIPDFKFSQNLLTNKFRIQDY